MTQEDGKSKSETLPVVSQLFSHFVPVKRGPVYVVFIYIRSPIEKCKT